MIGNILDNTTELYMIKYTFGENFSSDGATLYKNPSDQTVHTERKKMKNHKKKERKSFLQKEWRSVLLKKSLHPNIHEIKVFLRGVFQWWI